MTSKNEAGRSRAEPWEAGGPPTLPPWPFLVISLGQPQGNPLGCTPLLANGSGHPSELGSARRAGNGALGGPKAHRKLQAHPSLASQGSKKSKGSTKSAASQIPLQAQEGKYPPTPGGSSKARFLKASCRDQQQRFWLQVQSQPHARPTGPEPLGGAGAWVFTSLQGV